MKQTQERWLEQSLWTTEPLVSNRDHLTVGQFVRFLQTAAGGGCGHLLLEVEGHVGQLLLDVTHDLTFG